MSIVKDMEPLLQAFVTGVRSSKVKRVHPLNVAIHPSGEEGEGILGLVFGIDLKIEGSWPCHSGGLAG